MLEYDELDTILLEVNAEPRAAECHGFLCGQICVAGFPDTQVWHEYLNVQSVDNERIQDCYTRIHTLVTEIRAVIASSDFDFQLLLPEEETSLSERVDALGKWCHGFLNGFGLEEDVQSVTLDEACRELIEDFTRICHVGLDEDEGHENEQALIELIEYVRIGAMTLFETFQPYNTADEERPEVLH